MDDRLGVSSAAGVADVVIKGACTGSAFGNHVSLFATRDGRLFLEMMNTDDPGLPPKTIRAFDASVSALANITCRS